MSESKLAEVSYQIGTYKGTVYVNCTKDTESETIKARARSRAYRNIVLAISRTSFLLLDRLRQRLYPQCWGCRPVQPILPLGSSVSFV